jgi:ketosteroid isomerase-like protein
MRKRSLIVLIAMLVLGLSVLAQAGRPGKKKVSSGPVPDKAFMQTIMDAWSTLDTKKVAPYYAQGPGHVFYDVTPVKYNGWDEYAAGVAPVAADLKSITLTVNEDADVHPHGDVVWGNATVKGDFVHKSGKRDLTTYRWTVIWEKKDGKWVIVHDHFSAPTQ